jgi:hypothetical protein
MLDASGEVSKLLGELQLEQADELGSTTDTFADMNSSVDQSVDRSAGK